MYILDKPMFSSMTTHSKWFVVESSMTLQTLFFPVFISPHLCVDTSAAADHLHDHGSLEWHIVHHITIHAGVLKQGVVLI
jgi:hypothetical protein